MRTFIAHRVSGEDPKALRRLVTKIRTALRAAGLDEVYCVFLDSKLDPNTLGPKATMNHAFRKIGGCDFVFVLLHSEQKSEGVLMEVGFAFGCDIPMVVAVQEGVTDTYIPEFADQVIWWRGVDDLCEAIRTTEFNDYKRSSVLDGINLHKP